MLWGVRFMYDCKASWAIANGILSQDGRENDGDIPFCVEELTALLNDQSL